MIQRKQSLYLLFILCIGSFLLFGDPAIYSTTGADKWTEGKTGQVTVSIQKIERTLNEVPMLTTWNSYLIYSLGAMMALAFIALFLFKNRKLQLLLCGFNYIAMLATGVLIYVYALEGSTWVALKDNSNWHYWFWIGVLLPIWNFMAMRGIMNDEKLIRSMDRLR